MPCSSVPFDPLHGITYFVVIVQVLKKIGRKVRSSTSSSSKSPHPLTLLEHRSEIKGACLKEGQVGVEAVWPGRDGHGYDIKGACLKRRRG